METTEMEDALEGLAGPVFAGGRIAAKNGPSVIDWFRTRFGGRRIAVVGPEASGKSCFALFVRSGELPRKGYSHKQTLRTTSWGMETISVGVDARFKIRVRRHSEIPGQLTPEQTARELKLLKPNVLLVFLDQSSGLDFAKVWMKNISSELRSTQFSLPSKDRVKKLIFVANKYDLSTEEQFLAFERALSVFVSAVFRGAFERQVLRDCRVMPCVTVRTDHGVELVNDVLREAMEKSDD